MVYAFDILKGDNLFLLDQVIGVDGKQHRQLRGLARGHGRKRTHARVIVIARIDRVDLDVGVGLFELGDDTIHDLGQRTANRNRVIHRQLGLRRDRSGGQSCQGAC